eukprot:scaffold14619_cov146-Amphora_coffeaeformis.AAC.5
MVSARTKLLDIEEADTKDAGTSPRPIPERRVMRCHSSVTTVDMSIAGNTVAGSSLGFSIWCLSGNEIIYDSSTPTIGVQINVSSIQKCDGYRFRSYAIKEARKKQRRGNPNTHEYVRIAIRIYIWSVAQDRLATPYRAHVATYKPSTSRCDVTALEHEFNPRASLPEKQGRDIWFVRIIPHECAE